MQFNFIFKDSLIHNQRDFLNMHLYMLRWVFKLMFWTGSHLSGRDLIGWQRKRASIILETLLSHFHNPLGRIPTPCYMLESFCTDQLWILRIHCHLSLHCIGIIWRNSTEKLADQVDIPLICRPCLIYCTVCFSRWASFDHRCILIFHISYGLHPNHHNLHWFHTQCKVQLLLTTSTDIKINIAPSCLT